MFNRISTTHVAALAATLALGSSAVSGAVIAQYNFTTNNESIDTDPGSEAKPFVPGGGFDYNSGAGGNPAPAAGAELGSRIGSSIDLSGDDYFSFKVDPEPGFTMTLQSISFDYAIAAYSDPVQNTNFSLYSNVTGFSGSPIAVRTASSASSTPSGAILLPASFSNLSSEVEFRFYLDDAGSGSDTRVAWMDNVTLVGTVVPEPASLGLLGASAVLMVRRRRSGM